MKIKSNVDVNINLLKVMSCIMIVILHSFSDGIKSIYFLGTYGVPLFIFINGYLLYSKNLTYNYLFSKILKIVRLVATWSTLLALSETVVKKMFINPFVIFLESLRGKNSLLFQFWFLAALAVIYILIIIILFITKKKIQTYITLNTVCILTGLSIIVYITNLIFVLHGKNEIRVIIEPEFRIITNCEFFVLGMTFRAYKDKIFEFINIRIPILYFLIIFNYFYIIMSSYRFNIKWASSYYNSIFVILGVSSLFCLVKKAKLSNKLSYRINSIADVTTGVFILHTFFIAVYNHIFSSTTVLALYGKFVFALIGSAVATKIILKIKYFNFLFKY